MLLSQKLAGFSKGNADVLRKAMGKKQISILDKMKKDFIEGASAKGHPAEVLEKIWKDWEAFAQYAFNKSHSTCYAFVAYQTAYLKAHYPSEYMAAVLNHAGSIEKITFFMEECKRMGIKVLGPCVNESQKGFAVNDKGEIRFGLGGLKGSGDAAIDSLISERKRNGLYKDVFDFSVRLAGSNVNKKSLETFAYGGAFDCFPDLHRAQYFYAPEGERATGLEKIVTYGQMLLQNNATNVNSLFGDLPASMTIPLPKIAPCEPWPLTTKLEHERDVTGMFISGHPLDNYRFELKHYGIMPLADFNEIRESTTLSQSNVGKNFKLAGLVTVVQQRTTKTNREFGIISIEDYTGKTEFALFGEDYQKHKSHFEVGKSLLINGVLRAPWKEGGNFEFKVASVYLLETVKDLLTKSIDININPALLTGKMVDFIANNVKQHPGKVAMRFSIREQHSDLKILLNSTDKLLAMNDDMADFLLQHPELEFSVTLQQA